MDDHLTFGPECGAIAFPLGGVGTGNVSLGARGDLRDWELDGEANKGSTLPNAFFGLWVDGDPEIVRVLEGPLPRQAPMSHGHHPTSHAGVQRFPDSRFRGTYPIARIEYVDDALPVEVALEAWTPLVPLDADESGIPVGLFEFSIANRADRQVTTSIAASLINPVGTVVHDPFGAPIGTQHGVAHNGEYESGELRGVVFENPGLAHDDLHFGSVALLTDLDHDVTVAPVWHRGGWWDDVRAFWDDFGGNGRLEADHGVGPSVGKPDTGSVAVRTKLDPGETARVRYYLSWHFPNRHAGWCSPGNTPQRHDGRPTPLVRKKYATRFDHATTVAEYTHRNRERLDATTYAFRDALFDSTLPAWIVRPVSANIVTLRSPTCFWLEDGSFYGWEGCFGDGGCCPGSCTHVWSYAYTGAYLFPDLERRMRITEFESESDDTGYMNFRAHASFEEEFVWVWGEGPRPAIDGQLGSIIRTWREFVLSGDRDWLARLWPSIERSMDYVMARWDSTRSGMVSGDQHNTYDIEFWGANPLAQFIYLTALEAAGAIAESLGHTDTAASWRDTANAGRARSEAELWNGTYYVQPSDDIDEHPYQHGDGCLSDQLLGHVHAIANDLPAPIGEDRARRAYRSIFEHNFRPSLREHNSYQRVFATGDQAGLVLCSWPHDDPPVRPFPYSDEVWTGVEYHVAAGMIASGLDREAEMILLAAADRLDGTTGNPWDEIECGHHYARAMSSWLLLLTAAGQATGEDRILRFSPRAAFFDRGRFRSFYSDGQSWGILTVDDLHATLDVLGGTPPTVVEVDGGKSATIRTRAHPS